MDLQLRSNKIGQTRHSYKLDFTVKDLCLITKVIAAIKIEP